MTVATDDPRQPYVFCRTLGREDVLVVLNRGDKPVVFAKSALTGRRYQDALAGVVTPAKLTVPALGVVVLWA